MNNKSNILKKSSTILLATVLMVGFIGMSSTSSIFAQYYNDYEKKYSQYYDNYEKSYEKYIKDDYSKSSTQNIKINCDNSNRNPSDNNGDTSNAFEAPNGNSQSGQDRMNADQKGNFKVICQNNNNLIINGNIENTTNFIDNSTTVLNACNTEISAENENPIDIPQSNTGDGTLTNVSQSNSATVSNSQSASSSQATTLTNSTLNCQANQNRPVTNTDPGVITSSSTDNIEQPSVLSQDVKSFQKSNGIAIQQQRTEDSHDLTAMEKVTKLKTQWLSQLP